MRRLGRQIQSTLSFPIARCLPIKYGPVLCSLWMHSFSGLKLVSTRAIFHIATKPTLANSVFGRRVKNRYIVSAKPTDPAKPSRQREIYSKYAAHGLLLGTWDATLDAKPHPADSHGYTSETRNLIVCSKKLMVSYICHAFPHPLCCCSVSVFSNSFFCVFNGVFPSSLFIALECYVHSASLVNLNAYRGTCADFEWNLSSQFGRSGKPKVLNYPKIDENAQISFAMAAPEQTANGRK